MKVVVIGDTTGIGKKAKEYFLKNNYEVFLISRTNGIDIHDNLDRVIDICKQSDVVFINLCYKDYQLKILKQIYKHVPHVIVSGGIIREYEKIKPDLAKVKKELFDFCKVVSCMPIEDNACNLLHLDFSFNEDSNSQDRFDNKNTTSLESIVSVIDNWFKHPVYWNVQFNFKYSEELVNLLKNKDDNLDNLFLEINNLRTI
jgi:3-phosphoglycerate kinase